MGEEGRSLTQTPTWAVAGVCAVIVLISILLEKALHSLATLLKNKNKAALCEALDKVKGELMVLGFISLLLTFSQGYISTMCIPSSIANKMLPCNLDQPTSSASDHGTDRRLLGIRRAILSTASSGYQCTEGKEPMITAEAAHQLHILIFFLAVFHVVYSAMTMMLGKLKTRKWKNWEREISSPEFESSHDPTGYRLSHETSFVKTHSSFWTRIPFFFYVGCFCRQFCRSVNKSDYLTLRNGFITAHIGPGGKFDFQKYIKRSLEDDFKMVVGVSPVLWASFVIFLLLNVNGWHTLLWASIIPLIAILAIGTKLQAILTNMALEIADRHTVVQGIPLVQGSDTYFWFSNPRLILHLLHFTLFQNAFQITYLLWILYQFQMKSCLHEAPGFEFMKIVIGIGAMVLCSYSTLPLYALVSQMGSHMKKNIFHEQTTKALKRWSKDVKKKKKEAEARVMPPRALGVATSKSLTSSSRRQSSGRILQRFMSTGRLSRTTDYDQLQESDYEGEEKSTMDTLIVTVNNDQGEREASTPPNDSEIIQEDDFLDAKSSSLN